MADRNAFLKNPFDRRNLGIVDPFTVAQVAIAVAGFIYGIWSEQQSQAALETTLDELARDLEHAFEREFQRSRIQQAAALMTATAREGESLLTIIEDNPHDWWDVGDVAGALDRAIVKAGELESELALIGAPVPDIYVSAASLWLSLYRASGAIPGQHDAILRHLPRRIRGCKGHYEELVSGAKRHIPNWLLTEQPSWPGHNQFKVTITVHKHRLRRVCDTFRLPRDVSDIDFAVGSRIARRWERLTDGSVTDNPGRGEWSYSTRICADNEEERGELVRDKNEARQIMRDHVWSKTFERQIYGKLNEQVAGWDSLAND